MEWSTPWQSPAHAIEFDGYAHMNRTNFLRHVETFHEIRLLRPLLRDQPQRLADIGCGTGDVWRYLSYRAPQVWYYGCDLSATAIARAREKYPLELFQQTSLEALPQTMYQFDRPDIVLSRDVLPHCLTPWEHLDRLLALSTTHLLLRLRTRDQGTTQLDPAQSCRYLYGQWVPWILLNLDETVARIRQQWPQSDLHILRAHQPLAGREDRYLPKDCYEPKTGCAVTAIHARQAGRANTLVQDAPEPTPRYTLSWRLWNRLQPRFPPVRASASRTELLRKAEPPHTSQERKPQASVEPPAPAPA